MSADFAEWLPPLCKLNDHNGEWERYLAAVYRHFVRDFISSKPRYQDKRFAMKRHPSTDGKEATFWHIISEGKDEANRIPDMRRCERIRWPRPVIDAIESGRIKMWVAQKKGDTRPHIVTEDFSYLVVLADRGEYFLLWTAYPLQFPRDRERLRKEYERHQQG